MLLVITIASYPIDPYRIVGTGFSLFRVFGILYIVLTILLAIIYGLLRNNISIMLLFALLTYFSFHYFLSVPHSIWATSKYNAYTFGIVLALSIAQRPNSMRYVLMGIQLAFWVTIPFVFHSLYTFIILRTIIKELPSLPGFVVGTGGWLAEGHNFEGLVRLAAPFPAPQFLGLLAAITAFVTLWQILHYPHRGILRWILSITLGAAVFIALGSLSRSAILPGIIWILALLMTRVRKIRREVRFVLPAMVTVGIFVLVIAKLGVGNIGEIAFKRMESSPNSFGRHLDTRLAALSMWTASSETMMFGTAFGEYGQLEAADGPHSHSSYTTLLPEVGLVGCGLFVLLLAYLLYKTKKIVSANGISFRLISMLTFALFLYEFLALQFIWCLIGGATSATLDNNSRLSSGLSTSLSLSTPQEKI